MTLIAAMWSQTSRWGGEGAAQQRALRLPRIIELAASQWAERRTSISLARQGQSVLVTPGRIEFITTVPILRPDLPLVTASYAVEPDLEGVSRTDGTRRSAQAWKLIYSERPVSDLSGPQRPIDPRADAAARAADLAEQSEQPSSVPGLEQPAVSTIALLEGCSELQLEWFDDGSEARRAALESKKQRAQQDPNNKATALPEPLEAQKPPPLQWLPLTTPLTRPPRAARFRGIYQGEPFSCDFILGASR